MLGDGGHMSVSHSNDMQHKQTRTLCRAQVWVQGGPVNKPMLQLRPCTLLLRLNHAEQSCDLT